MYTKNKHLWSGIAVFLSTLLYYVSWPPSQISFAIFTAFIPLLILILTSHPKNAFTYGLITGVTGWLFSIKWLLKLSITATYFTLAFLAWISLAFYAGSYTALFCWITSSYLNNLNTKENTSLCILPNRPYVTLSIILFTPTIWTGLEYIRYRLFSGFPWNALAIALYNQPILTQIADIGGIFLISWVIMTVNICLAISILKLVYSISAKKFYVFWEFFLACFLITVCTIYSLNRIINLDGEIKKTQVNIKITSIQTDFKQKKKWEENYIELLKQQIEKMCKETVREEVDLVVFPETTVPDYCLLSNWNDIFTKATEGKSSILVGCLHTDIHFTGPEWLRPIYNSSILYTDGKPTQIYAKRYLVLFGEYLPFDSWIPALKRLAPLGFCCVSGKSNTIFSLTLKKRNTRILFSSLICIEGSIPWLARIDSGLGSCLIVNQTNDAWFEKTSGPIQHLAQTIFRAIEIRKPLIRSANGGISCMVDIVGRISKIDPEQNSLFKTWKVPVNTLKPTLYQKFGDIICGLPCAIFVLCILVNKVISTKLKNPSSL